MQTGIFFILCTTSFNLNLFCSRHFFLLLPQDVTLPIPEKSQSSGQMIEFGLEPLYGDSFFFSERERMRKREREMKRKREAIKRVPKSGGLNFLPWGKWNPKRSSAFLWFTEKWLHRHFFTNPFPFQFRLRIGLIPWKKERKNQFFFPRLKV